VKRLFIVLGMALMTAVAITWMRKTPAPAYAPPKTAWGDPDLHGTYASDDFLGVPFERPSQFGDRATLTDSEFAARAKANADQIAKDAGAHSGTPFGTDADANSSPSHWIERGTELPRASSIVVDPPNGRIPGLTAEGARHLALARLRSTRGDNAAEHSNFDRCITRGVVQSMLPDVAGGSGTSLAQTPGQVVIRNEMIHEARVIPIDSPAPRLGKNIHLYMGDPRGHWDGDTLVVDSTNFTDRTGLGANTVSSASLHLVEKFSRTAPGTMHYEFIVDDPATYTATWSGALDLRATPGYEIYEYACHEGNYGLRNMLSASRADDANAKR
jgi:hypothetical protein